MYYEAILWDVIALCAICALLGLIGGLYVSRWTIRKVPKPEAPTPDFDITNPMNARARTEVIGGVEWTVYGGQDKNRYAGR